MRKMMLLAAFLMLGAAAAFGYTFPDAFVYDGLITYDHGGMPLVPGALHLSANPGYWMASEYFDNDGEVQETPWDTTVIAVPIDVGYAINENILVDVTLQVLSTKWTPEVGDEISAAGLGDVWIKGRYLAPVDGLNLGGRLAVKVPVGKVDYDWEDPKPPLGDDQMDIDVGLVAGMYPDEGFAMNGQLGFRYRMPRTEIVYAEDPLNPGQLLEIEEEYTPGMLIYFHAEPGYTMGPTNFQVYVPIGYEMSMTAKWEGEELEDSETSGLYVGLAPKYGIDSNNLLGVKFLYPLMGNDVPKSMLVGLTYEGYIPM